MNVIIQRWNASTILCHEDELIELADGSELLAGSLHTGMVLKDGTCIADIDFESESALGCILTTIFVLVFWAAVALSVIALGGVLMFLLILLVLFVMVMFLWLLSMLGAVENPKYSPWLGWFACLILGAVVFLTTAGIIVVERTIGR